MGDSLELALCCFGPPWQPAPSCLFALCQWFSLLSDSPSFIKLHGVGKNIYIGKHFQNANEIFSLCPAILLTRKKLLYLWKCMLSQYQILNLNLSRIICWLLRHLGLDKEKLKKFAFMIVFLWQACIPEAWKERQRARGSDGQGLHILCQGSFPCVFYDLGVNWGSGFTHLPSGSMSPGSDVLGHAPVYQYTLYIARTSVPNSHRSTQ